LRTTDKNETKRKISTPACVMDVQGKPQKENVPITARMCKLEEDMVDVVTKLNKDMVDVFTKLNDITNIIKNTDQYH
jgi:hypothetical protein